MRVYILWWKAEGELLQFPFLKYYLVRNVKIIPILAKMFISFVCNKLYLFL